MTTVTLSSLGKSYGDRVLFENATMRLEPGHRYGLVGANGSGKTTLMGILTRTEPASSGDITYASGCRIGVLHQDRYLSEEQRIIDVAMMGDEPVWKMLRDQAALVEQHAQAEQEANARAIAELEDQIGAADGYTLQSRAASIVEGLGIPTAAHDDPLSSLSGGFKLRVLLAQTLIGRPDLLLLDEPTNHLDILTIRWLETFLADYPGCAIVISHDHRFLDAVATDILDVDYQTVTHYVGNYRAFALEKEQTRARVEAESARVEKEIAHKKAFVERFRYKSTKARQAQSRLKQIEKIEIPEVLRSSRQRPFFRFEQTRKSGKEVVELRHVSKSYDDLRVLRDVSITVRRGERVAVIGANGLGKSTLLKILVGRLDADGGEVEWGYETSTGYFAQNHGDLLSDPNQTALDFLWDCCPQEPTNFVRGQLGKVLFSGEDVEKKLRSLSGGEAARLIFSRLIVEKPNVLVLDEPTNHLDLEAIEALVDGLTEYPGTLLFVSHDRWFVSKLATRIIEIREDGLVDYPGTYDDYLARCGDDHLDAEAVLRKAAADRNTKPQEAAAGTDWHEQKRKKSNLRKLQTEHTRVTAEIEQAESRLAAIRQRYCEPGFFEQTSNDEASALQDEERTVGIRVEQLMERWELIEEELAGLSEPE